MGQISSNVFDFNPQTETYSRKAKEVRPGLTVDADTADIMGGLAMLDAAKASKGELSTSIKNVDPDIAEGIRLIARSKAEQTLMDRSASPQDYYDALRTVAGERTKEAVEYNKAVITRAQSSADPQDLATRILELHSETNGDAWKVQKAIIDEGWDERLISPNVLGLIDQQISAAKNAQFDEQGNRIADQGAGGEATLQILKQQLLALKNSGMMRKGEQPGRGIAKPMITVSGGPLSKAAAQESAIASAIQGERGTVEELAAAYVRGPAMLTGPAATWLSIAADKIQDPVGTLAQIGDLLLLPFSEGPGAPTLSDAAKDFKETGFGKGFTAGAAAAMAPQAQTLRQAADVLEAGTITLNTAAAPSPSVAQGEWFGEDGTNYKTIAVDLIQGGQTLGYQVSSGVLATALTGNPVIGAAVGAGVGAGLDTGSVMQETYQKLTQNGATPANARATAANVGLVYAPVSMILEYIPMEEYLRKSPVGKAATDKLTEIAIQKAIKYGTGMGKEGVTEAAQEAWQDFSQWAVANDAQAFNDWQARYAKAGTLGAILGGGAMVVTAPFNPETDVPPDRLGPAMTAAESVKETPEQQDAAQARRRLTVKERANALDQWRKMNDLTPENSRVVAGENLDPAMRYIDNLGKSIGVDVVFVDTGGILTKAPAASSRAGMVVIDTADTATEAGEKFFQHEVIHEFRARMERTGQQDAYQKLVDAVRAIAPDQFEAARSDYAARAQAAGLDLSQDLMDEEGIANVAENLATGFLRGDFDEAQVQAMAQRSPNLVERLISAGQRALKTFRLYSGQTLSERIRGQATEARLMAEYRKIRDIMVKTRDLIPVSSDVPRGTSTQQPIVRASDMRVQKRPRQQGDRPLRAGDPMGSQIDPYSIQPDQSAAIPIASPTQQPISEADVYGVDPEQKLLPNRLSKYVMPPAPERPSPSPSPSSPQPPQAQPATQAMPEVQQPANDPSGSVVAVQAPQSTDRVTGSRAELLRRIKDLTRDDLEATDPETMMQAAENQAGDGEYPAEFTTSFAGPIPAEVKDALQGKFNLMRFVKANVPNGRGADSIAALGVDKWVQLLESMNKGTNARALDAARNHRNPTVQLLAHLYDTAARTRTRRADGTMRSEGATPKQAVNVSDLPMDSEFTINGERMVVIKDENDEPTLYYSKGKVYAPDVGTLQVDRGSLRQMTEDEATQEAMGRFSSEDGPMDLPFALRKRATEPVTLANGRQVMADPRTLQPDFIDYFGDWINNPEDASKIVDDQGRPLVMHHGTPAAGFEVFDKTKSPWKVPGFFSEDADYSSGYARASRYTSSSEDPTPGMYAVYLNIRNPIDIRGVDMGRFVDSLPDEIWDVMTDSEKQAAKRLDESIGGISPWPAVTLMRSIAERLGRDGVIWLEGRYDNLRHTALAAAPLRPEQIKSVNAKSYTKNDPNILFALRAYHGSPHTFDRFSTQYMGTGEGAQAYGWGLYFAGAKEVAEYYKKNLSRTEIDRVVFPDGSDIDFKSNVYKPEYREAYSTLLYTSGDIDEAIKNIEGEGEPETKAGKLLQSWKDAGARVYVRDTGRLYEVNLKPDEDEYLLWDKPLSEQSQKVKDAIDDIPMVQRWKESGAYSQAANGGQNLYNYLSKELGSTAGPNLPAWMQGEKIPKDMNASLDLRARGVRGIKYLDGSSRPDGSILSKQIASLLAANNNDVDAAFNQYMRSVYNTPAQKAKIGAAIRKDFERAANPNYNYVIFDDADVDIEAMYALRRNRMDANQQADVAGQNGLFGQGTTRTGQQQGGLFGSNDPGRQIENVLFGQSAANVDQPDSLPLSPMERQPGESEQDYKLRMKFREAEKNTGTLFALRNAVDLVKNDPAFRSWFGESKVVDANGDPLVLFHGSTKGFDQFKMVKANPENFFGRGFYFSDSMDDVNANYAGEGPDLKNRIAQEVSRIMDSDGLEWNSPEYKAAMEVAREKAKKKLGVQSGGAVYPVFVRMTNPMDGRPDSPTRFTHELRQNRDGDIVGERGTWPKFVRALDAELAKVRNAGGDAADTQEVLAKVYDEISYEMDGVPMMDVLQFLRESEPFTYVSDARGNFVSADVMRNVIKRMGFDGIIHEAQTAARNMPNVEGATHYIVWDATSVKSINNTAFNPDDPRLNFALRGSMKGDPRVRDFKQLQKQAMAEKPGQQTIGRPDLANPGQTEQQRRLVNAADELRKDNLPNVQKDEQVFTEADSRLSADKNATKQDILRKVRAGELLDSVETVIGQKLVADAMQNVLKNGKDADYLEAIQIHEAYRLSGTDAARAFRLRADRVETPAQRNARFLGQLLAEPDSITRKQIDKARQKMLEAKNPAQRSGFEKDIESLQARQAQKAGKIVENLQKAGIDPRQINDQTFADPIASAKIARVVSSTKSGLRDKISEYWINAILSAPTTQVANITGNMAYGVWENTIQRAIEAAAADSARLVGVNVEGATLGEFRAMAKASGPAFRRAAQNFLLAWQTEQPQLESQVGAAREDMALFGPGMKLEQRQGQAAIGGKTGRVVRAFGTRQLLAFDEFFKALWAETDAHARAYRIATNQGLTGEARWNRVGELVADLGSEAWEDAVKHAEHLAFQDENALAKGVVNIREGLNDAARIPIGTFILPFVKTPLNIAIAAAEKTPLATVQAAYHILTGKWKSSPESIIKDVANNMVGWGVFALLSALVDPDDDQPWITGATPTNRGEREMAYRVAPPMSIKINGNYISYARIEPFATALGLMVDAIEQTKRSGSAASAAANIGNSIREQIQDKTFLQGLGDIVNLFTQSSDQAEANAAKWAKNFTVSWVPNIARKAAQATDPMLRERRIRQTDEGGVWTNAMERVGQEVFPIGSVAPPPKVDLWGREISSRSLNSPATDFAYRFLIPAQIREADENKIDALIIRFNATVPDQDRWFPTIPNGNIQRTINGQKQTYRMSDEEYNQFLVESGRESFRQLSNTRLNWDNPTQRDIDIIKKVLEANRSVAREKVLKARG